MALPTLYPQLSNPASNLAATLAVPSPIATPVRRHYVAADGTSIGYGGTCDPITAEMGLSAIGDDWYDFTDYVPEVLQENRVSWMEEFSMPLAIAALGYGMGARPMVTAALSAGSYFAPYPAALFVAWRAAGPRLMAAVGGKKRNVRTAYKPIKRAPRTRPNVRYR